jgi:hypothetical protein
LCIVIDESTNIANYRIINTSIVIDSRVSTYHLNKEAEEGKIEAKELAAYTVKEAKDIIGGDLLKWTAVTLDTCATIKAFEGVLAKILEAAHLILSCATLTAFNLSSKIFFSFHLLRRSLMKLLQSLASSNILQSNTHISKSSS